MNLQPPSFFEITPPQEDAKVERAILTKWREELARLNRENKLLKQRLETYITPPRMSPPSPHLCTASLHLPPLTSDPLHVEEHLQSRLRVLENEKKETSLQVLELEKTLVLHRKEFHKQVESLKVQHEEAMCKVESDRHRMSAEYQAYKEDKERQVKLLTAEVAMQREHYSTQTEQLLSKNSKLEHGLIAMESDKEGVKRNLEAELASLNKQLALSKEENASLRTDTSAQLSTLMEQVSAHCQKVKRLEAYLGGEIPDLEKQQQGSTWKQEREFLHCELQKNGQEVQKLRSESYLLNVRLSSMSEILSLQEADITKSCTDDQDRVRSLLTRWREKVYVLMVQEKLKEIEETRAKEETQRRESTLVEKVKEAEREQSILSHVLADKSAQLQLQKTKTKEVKTDLDKTKVMLRSLEKQLCLKSEACIHISNSARSISQLYAGFQGIFNQALTQLANYEHRIAFAVKRIKSLRATVSSRNALVQSKLVGTCDAGCQVCGGPEEMEHGVCTLTRMQLELEVQTLSQERDGLIGQLRESTGAFQQQLKSLKDKYVSESLALEGRLTQTEAKRVSLEQNLAELHSKFTSSEEDKENLTKMTQELSRDLESLRASMESRIESEVTKQKHRSREELSEMEKLLSVARREHSKAIVQLQQLTRKVNLNKERAVEVAEMSRARMETELTTCRKQLQTVQVERNLLMTTLRQEGGAPPLKAKHFLGSPRQREDSDNSPTQQHEGVGCGSGLEKCSGSEDESEGGTGQTDQQQEDIRDVLKDLHMLSASLLSMEPEPGVGTG